MENEYISQPSIDSKERKPYVESKVPLIVIVLGPTASGKSKFAQLLNQGIILNADSQQVYKHLKIACNRDYDIPLSGFMNPEEMCDVRTWVNMATEIIEKENIQNRQRVVIVGGTDYYLDYLIRKETDIAVCRESCEGELPEHSTLRDGASENKLSEKLCQSNEETISSKEPECKSVDESIKTLLEKFREGILSPQKKYELLNQIDSDYLNKIHKNDVRKIDKAIQFFLDNNLKRSQVAQSSAMRYPNIVIFRLSCNQDILDKRIEKRVDEMISMGLIEELLDFRENIEPFVLDTWREQQGWVGDIPSKGIFQCIGYKEMRPYINALLHSRKSEQIDIETDPSLLNLLHQCTEKLKTATKQYSHQQNKWFKKRWAAPNSPLFNDTRNGEHHLFEVDVSSVSNESWDQIRTDVQAIVSCLENQQCIPNHLLEKYGVKSQAPLDQEWSTYQCETCELQLLGSTQWKLHLNSRRHRKRKANIAKRKRQKIGDEHHKS